MKAGRPQVAAPVYSHLVYDIVPGEQTVTPPAGHPAAGGAQRAAARAGRGGAVAVSDFIDFSVYVDAATDDIRRWYVERFLRLRETAFRDPSSYFRRYAALDERGGGGAGGADLGGDQRAEPGAATSSRPAGGRRLVLRKGPDHQRHAGAAAQGVIAAGTMGRMNGATGRDTRRQR